MRRGLSILVLGLLHLSCHQVFEPKSEFYPQIVVFSILSNDRDTQVVRLSKTYDPPGLDPYIIREEQSVSDASVFISEGMTTYPLRYSPLPRPDTSRYRTALQAYRGFFPVEYNKQYSLRIIVPGFDTVFAWMGLPEKPSLRLEGSFILTHPEKFLKEEEITFESMIASGVMGITVRFFIEYETSTAEARKQEHFEVPFLFRDEEYTVDRGIYPTLFRYSAGRFRHTYPNGGYLAALKKIIELNPNKRITFQRIVFLLLQAEPNFYKYYKITNGFGDRGSIRLDQPNYSNIVNGLGVFGGYTVDSLIVPLPDDFSYNIR